MHAPRQFRRKKVGYGRFQPDAAQLFHRNLARLGPGALLRAAQEAEGDVLPDRQAVEKRAALKEHPEPGKEGIARSPVGRFAIDKDLPAIGRHKAKDAFQQHRLAGARSADDHHAFAPGDGQVDPVQDGVGAKGLVNVAELDHAEKNTSVRR